MFVSTDLNSENLYFTKFQIWQNRSLQKSCILHLEHKGENPILYGLHKLHKEILVHKLSDLKFKLSMLVLYIWI
jgi:hypothetical protein